MPSGNFTTDTRTNLINGKEIKGDSKELEWPNKSFKDEIVIDKHDEKAQEEKNHSDPPLAYPNKFDKQCIVNRMENASNKVLTESYSTNLFKTFFISTF